MDPLLAYRLCRASQATYDDPQAMAREFGLGIDLAASKTRLLEALEQVLRRTHADGVATALIVDEAQSLPHELLEEIRLLANIETPSVKLLPIVLAGQPELADRLNHPSLRSSISGRLRWLF